MPASQWRELLELLVAGLPVEKALTKLGVSLADFDETLRTSLDHQAEYEDAKTAAIRAGWTMAQLEEVMNAVVGDEEGGNLGKIVEARKRNYVEFLRLIERDAHVGSMYAEARQLWTERKMEDMIVLLAEDKVDNAKLKGLQWLMGALNDKYKTSRTQAKTEKESAALEARLTAGRRRVEALWEERIAAESPFG